SQQALSIIVRRNFSSGTGNDITKQAVGTAGEAVSEFAFNKLNSVISQSNAIKNLDLNIRSFNDASASLRLFNERFVLSGSLFNNTGSANLFNNNTSLFNTNFNNLYKDFSAQYLILKNGSLNARYSYKLLNSTTLNDIDQIGAQYVNGLGLLYQRDFDSFGEFIKNMFHNGNRQRANPLPVPPDKPSGTPKNPQSNGKSESESPGDDDQ
ncbi:MAG: hypothetical protein JST19_23325, partial [Bacteroidetes bacterium]|nr:hypothetical protein [Bacteroidota bacterium]